MSSQTFLWHDYETFGRDSLRDRAVQFAAIRTDDHLEEIDDRTMIYCRQSADYLPDPGSCLVHGVLPQQANREGMPEWQFANAIHRQMSWPGTCSLGYNTIRFDDEFTRQLLFRNLFDPYAREWQHGNSRWDLIDVVRLARALRPQGIEWPTLDDGTPSNKLEHLTDANGISHADAHDALADVAATIAIAKLLKKAQPRLFEFAFHNRRKVKVQEWLRNPDRPALLHISGMYRNSLGNLSIVLPLCPHPTNSNGTLVYDLRVDPTPLISSDWQTIAERMFTPRDQLPQGIERIAVKTIHSNRAPVIAPLPTLTESASQQWQLDVNQALRFREMLLAARDLTEKLTQAIVSREYPGIGDAELSLYGGAFATESDRAQMRHVQHQLQNGDRQPTAAFDDPRWHTLLERMIFRNQTDSLDAQQRDRWRDLCRARVIEGTEGYRNIQQYNDIIDQMADTADPAMLHTLREYGRDIAAFAEGEQQGEPPQ
jgi:exodeoxyribonuclease-1